MGRWLGGVGEASRFASSRRAKRGRFAYIHAAAGPFYLLNVGQLADAETKRETSPRLELDG